MRNILGKDPPPLRDTISRSIQRLKIQQRDVVQASFKLKMRDRALFRKCIVAMENNNQGRANICANELVQIKRIINFLYNVELAIERVILRLETLRELGDIIVDLKPALRMLQRVSKQLFEVMPEVSSELREVNETITETLYSTEIRTDGSEIPEAKITLEGEEVLEEVSSFLKRKIADNLPEPPETETVPEAPLKQMVALAATCAQTVSQRTAKSENGSDQNPLSFEEAAVQEISLRIGKHARTSLEDVLMEYVRKNKGEVDIVQCSLALNASYSEIEKALQNLGAKGKIQIETEMGEEQ